VQPESGYAGTQPELRELALAAQERKRPLATTGRCLGPWIHRPAPDQPSDEPKTFPGCVDPQRLASLSGFIRRRSALAIRIPRHRAMAIYDLPDKLKRHRLG
jgi:hypothetical protein